MKSLSKNLYKSYYVAVSDDEKCIIDSNLLVADRIEKHEAERRARMRTLETPSEDDEEFVGGLMGEEVDALFADSGDNPEGDTVIKASSIQQAPDPEEINRQAESILEDARAQAESILEEAKAQIESMRIQTHRDAKEEGYREGFQKGMEEAEQMKREVLEMQSGMEQEYNAKLEELEPKFIEAITAVYSHIFGVDLIENRDILVHLIDSALRQVESSRTFIVHVSAEDFPYVNMQKQALTEGALSGKGMLEIVEDIAMSKGACLIETDGGIFDCGVDTQLQELTRKLRVLSFDGSSD